MYFLYFFLTPLCDDRNVFLNHISAISRCSSLSQLLCSHIVFVPIMASHPFRFIDFCQVETWRVRVGAGGVQSVWYRMIGWPSHGLRENRMALGRACATDLCDSIRWPHCWSAGYGREKVITGIQPGLCTDLSGSRCSKWGEKRAPAGIIIHIMKFITYELPL